MNDHAFFSEQEQQACQRFLDQGYLTFPLADRQILTRLRRFLFEESRARLDLPLELDEPTFFDQTLRWMSPARLNAFRLALIGRVNQDRAHHPEVYRLARQQLHLLVGNELAMQRALNLSIQLPDDDSSLLPLHSDVWSGNSPYEVVFWLPLVDCYKSRSMFLLPKPQSDRVLADFPAYSKLSTEAFYREIEEEVTWIELPFGHGMIFWHGLIHGNRINREGLTRWSLNVRFKSLLSPYGVKEVGESFFPMTVRPATRLGFAYREPTC